MAQGAPAAEILRSSMPFVLELQRFERSHTFPGGTTGQRASVPVARFLCGAASVPRHRVGKRLRWGGRGVSLWHARNGEDRAGELGCIMTWERLDKMPSL